MKLFAEIHSRLPSIGDRKVRREGIIELPDVVLLRYLGERRDPGFRPNRPVPDIKTSNSDKKEKNKHLIKLIE
jgi:hypothetical protein